jgi:aminopeptidase N
MRTLGTASNPSPEASKTLFLHPRTIAPRSLRKKDVSSDRKIRVQLPAAQPGFLGDRHPVLLMTFALISVDDLQLGSGGNVNANSPYAVSSVLVMVSLFFMFASTAFVANVVVRDEETRFGPILRATRITKAAYLLGRFTGAFAAVALVFAVVPAALWLGSMMPWIDTENFGPNRLADYAYAYFLLALPTIFAMSAIFFALATVTRSMMWAYLGVVGFFILYFVASSLAAQQPQLETALSYADPFGGTAYGVATEYWTAAERNAGNPPLVGALLFNRLLWLAIGVLFIALAYSRYRFADAGMSPSKQKKQKLEAAPAPEQPARAQTSGRLPDGQTGSSAAWAQLIARTRFEMGQIFKSPAYLVLLLLAICMTFMMTYFQNEIYGTPSLPRTVTIIPGLAAAFGIISMIIAIYYSGEMVWRERERKIHEIIDATPMPSWAHIVPKTIGVIFVLLSTLAAGALVGIFIQLMRGYTDISVGEYVTWYFLPNGVNLAFTAVLAVFIQALSPNKYAGWGFMVLFMVANIILTGLGFEHNLYHYGNAPPAPLSDLNGAGGFEAKGWWLRLYWTGFAIMMLTVAHLLWRRGAETRLRPRLRRLPRRLLGLPGLIGLGGLITATSAGAYIFYNMNVLNDYQTVRELEKFQAAYEKKYLRYEYLPQPSVTHVKLHVSIFPSETRAEVAGEYSLQNKTRSPISQIHIRNVDQDLEIKAVSVEGGRLATHDEEFEYRIFQLAKPMAPGEARRMTFRTQRWQRGFRNNGEDTKLVRNGTFLANFELTPVIGMGRRGMLQERAKRRKYGLPPELRMRKLEDLSATKKNYIGDWATSEITVSTSSDQTPIAPGRKVADVISGGRRTSTFRSDVPILNFFSIQSARYVERHRKHKGIDLTIYFHQGHDRNLDRMLDAMEASLDYFQENFGPYQFDQARIIEFPGYQTYAQSFANTIAYSETMGFTADFSNPKEIDYSTYGTAHELAHQYWGHQIAGADMQGSTLLMETLSQYSALMIMKRIHGEDEIRRFLKFELDLYLAGRSGEAVEEVPLVRVENQQYIYYNKGSLAMYLLQERLGEDAVNQALRAVLNKYKFKDAPFPRSIDLIQALRAEAKTPQHQALITDLFQMIAVYDLTASEAKASRRPDGKWDVTLTVDARKYYADGKGNETQAPLSEMIEVGLFTSEPGLAAFDQKNVIHMEPHQIRTGKQLIKLVARKKPTFIGVDPYNFYIDRKSDDNVVPVT